MQSQAVLSNDKRKIPTEVLCACLCRHGSIEAACKLQATKKAAIASLGDDAVLCNCTMLTSPY